MILTIEANKGTPGNFQQLIVLLLFSNKDLVFILTECLQHAIIYLCSVRSV